MNKEQALQVTKKYSWIGLAFAVSMLLEATKLLVTGLSILHKRMTLTQETSSDPEIQETVQNEITNTYEVVDTQLHDPVPESSSRVEDGEVDSVIEPVSDCFGRVQFVPDSIPFTVFDNQEQIEDAVSKAVCHS